MKNNYALLIITILLGVVVLFWSSIEHKFIFERQTPPVGCTMEAKICPDGTAVGRSGPKCEFSECPTIVATTVGSKPTVGDITLGVGQAGTVAGLSVTFNKLVQDSRCAIDVQCIEAGAVNTNVTLSDGAHTIVKNMPSDEVPYAYNGYHISIVDVVPPRYSKVETKPGAYHVTFHIVKD